MLLYCNATAAAIAVVVANIKGEYKKYPSRCRYFSSACKFLHESLRNC